MADPNSGWDTLDKGSSEISNPRKGKNMNNAPRASAPQGKSGSPLPVILVIILLLLLGGGLFWYFSQPQAPAKPETPAVTKPVEAPKEVKPVETTKAPKILGVHAVVPKDTLWWISDKWYKDPILWPNIYQINKNAIKDPDLIFPGMKLDIPALVGTKDKLAPEDKTSLSQGYLEAYRVYKAKGKKDAEDYKTVGDKYAKSATSK